MATVIIGFIATMIGGILVFTIKRFMVNMIGGFMTICLVDKWCDEDWWVRGDL